MQKNVVVLIGANERLHGVERHDDVVSSHAVWRYPESEYRDEHSGRSLLSICFVKSDAARDALCAQGYILTSRDFARRQFERRFIDYPGNAAAGGDKPMHAAAAANGGDDGAAAAAAAAAADFDDAGDASSAEDALGNVNDGLNDADDEQPSDGDALAGRFVARARAIGSGYGSGVPSSFSYSMSWCSSSSSSYGEIAALRHHIPMHLQLSCTYSHHQAQYRHLGIATHHDCARHVVETHISVLAIKCCNLRHLFIQRARLLFLRQVP